MNNKYSKRRNKRYKKLSNKKRYKRSKKKRLTKKRYKKRLTKKRHNKKDLKSLKNNQNGGAEWFKGVRNKCDECSNYWNDSRVRQLYTGWYSEGDVYLGTNIPEFIASERFTPSMQQRKDIISKIYKENCSRRLPQSIYHGYGGEDILNAAEKTAIMEGWSARRDRVSAERIRETLDP